MRISVSEAAFPFPKPISVSEANAQLTELVRRAQEGEEIVLTRHGQAVACIAPIRNPVSIEDRRRAIAAARAAAGKAARDPNVVRSQDFLYGDDGLPG
jgi:prevent-host-death family protein